MTDRLRETDDLTSWLRDEAVNIDSAVDEHIAKFGDYCRSHGDHFSSVAIIEYQLNKNHLGEEAIKLREAAEVIERQGKALSAVAELAQRWRRDIDPANQVDKHEPFYDEGIEDSADELEMTLKAALAQTEPQT